MAGGIDNEFIKTLIDKTDIVEVAGSYMHLEKKGGTYWACCPFHHEKTASFHVDEGRQFYHCFGCSASGNVITLVKEMENCDFVDAVKILAERAKLTIPQKAYDNEQTVALKKKRDTILKILNDSAHFYLNNLNSGKADAHIEYILSRKIPSNIVRAFGLGASLNYTDLPKFLLSKGYSKQDIIASGAVNEAEGRLTDSQGGRLIFPIIDAFGQVIAFGGRALKKTDFAKYKNTRETAVFNKSKTLYNINGLKKLKRGQTVNSVIMVEGYMDTISLYQGGFKNVVASMGTSLTQDQARLIKRYANTIYISYDGDGAGQKANMRGLEILKSEGLEVKVVPLPEGLDPDDVIKTYGAEGYQKCLDGAMSLTDYKMTVSKRAFDLDKPEEKVKYVSDALRIIKGVGSAAEREMLLKKLRDETGISYESLNRDLQSEPAPEEERDTAPPAVKKDESDAHRKASRFVIAAFLFDAPYTKDLNIEDVPFDDEVHMLIAGYIRSKRMFDENISIPELFEFFDDGSAERAELDRVIDLDHGDNMDGEVNLKTFADCLKKLKSDEIDKKIDELKRSFTQSDDNEERVRTAAMVQQLIIQKKKIKGGDIL
ncbi:MAG: DNA primase [Clostridia bacterium]|nr:DNA primase [Clostridia bacterium]